MYVCSVGFTMVMGRSTSSSPRTDGGGSKSRRGVKLKKRVGEEGPGRSVMRDAHNKEWQQQQKKYKDEEEEARLQEPTTTEQTRATSSEGEQRMRRKDGGAADKREITKESRKEEGPG